MTALRRRPRSNAPSVRRGTAGIRCNCRCTDANAVALRTPVTTAALLNVLALVLALSPCAESPADLRNEIAEMATRLLRLTRETLDSKDFEILLKMVGDVGGNA